MMYVLCSKTIDIPIIDREEYEKNRNFEIVISEPKLVHSESQAHIPDLRDVKDAEMRKIIEAGKPTLGEYKPLIDDFAKDGVEEGAFDHDASCLSIKFP